MTNETTKSVFIDLASLIADGAEKSSAGKRAKPVAPWITELLAKIGKGESVAIDPAIWEKANAKVRKAFKESSANAGYRVKATAYKKNGAVVAYVVARELDV